MASWTPKVGRSLFKLQSDIANRAAQLLSPGGRMVYSTCSLDPIENEAGCVKFTEVPVAEINQYRR